VDRQWTSRRGVCGFAPPKTAASHLVIPASAWVLEELSAHVSRRHDGFVLAQDGEPIRHGNFNWWWRRARDAAGLERSIRFHDLRHAFASALISAGCSVKAVQRPLGDASASTTLDTYGHLWPGDEDRIRQAVDAAHAQRAEDSLRTAGPHR
jgi:integrase